MFFNSRFVDQRCKDGDNRPPKQEKQPRWSCFSLKSYKVLIINNI